MIVAGILCLIAGYLIGIGILTTIGWVLVVVGLILLVLGHTGAVSLGGRKHWY